jgi:hypothetical protein
MCEMHDGRLVQTLSLLTAKRANSCVVGKPFSKLVAFSAGAQQQKLAGSLETKRRDFFYRLV